MLTISFTSYQLVMVAVLTVVAIVAVLFLWSYGQRGLVSKVQAAEVDLEDTSEAAESLRLRLGRAIEAKDSAYYERNMVLTLFLRVLQTENIEGWKVLRGYIAEFKGWEPAVYIDAPERYGLSQMSWNFKNPDQLWMLDSLGLAEGGQWNGHTTEEKYASMREFFMSGALAGKISAAAPTEGYQGEGTEPIDPVSGGSVWSYKSCPHCGVAEGEPHRPGCSSQGQGLL